MWVGNRQLDVRRREVRISSVFHLPLSPPHVGDCVYKKYICVIDQAFSVKIAGYWPRFVCVCFMDLDFISVHKNAKMNEANIQPS